MYAVLVLGRCGRCVAGGVGASTGGAADTIVNWGGTDYVTATRQYRGNDGATGTLDWDGDGNDDGCRYFVFSESLELNPIIGANDSGSSDRFYGGIEKWRVNGGIAGTGGESVNDNAAGDRHQVNDTNGSDRRHYGLWVWAKADFLALSGLPVVGFDAASAFTVNVPVNGSTHYCGDALRAPPVQGYRRGRSLCRVDRSQRRQRPDFPVDAVHRDGPDAHERQRPDRAVSGGLAQRL